MLLREVFEELILAVVGLEAEEASMRPWKWLNHLITFALNGVECGLWGCLRYWIFSGRSRTGRASPLSAIACALQGSTYRRRISNRRPRDINSQVRGVWTSCDFWESTSAGIISHTLGDRKQRSFQSGAFSFCISFFPQTNLLTSPSHGELCYFLKSAKEVNSRSLTSFDCC
jgi:hypothetical protein